MATTTFHTLADGSVVELNEDGHVIRSCPRCTGEGGIESYRHVQGGICFRCHGRGDRWLEPLAEHERKAKARQKRREAKARKQERDFVAWSETYPGLADRIKESGPHGEGFLTELYWIVNRREALTDRQSTAAINALDRMAAARERAEARREAAKAAGHVGTVGEKIELSVTVVATKTVESAYGISHLVVMQTPEGATVKTFSSGAFGRDASKGAELTIKGTVKEHSDYQGTPETMLTRVKLAA